MGKFREEFKEFIMRGNVIDMAVGVVVGGAFKAVVDSLVNDIIMPPLGLLIGGVDFSDMKIVLKEAAGETPEVAINIGLLINTIISFLIIALVIFLVVKGINKMRTKAEEARNKRLGIEEEEEEEEAPEPDEKELLGAILTELKKANGESVETEVTEEVLTEETK